MAPTVTRSQPNRASLGCGGTGALCPGCASHKSLSTARCYPINMGQQHLVESMPFRIKAVLKVKGGQTQCYGVPNNPLGECIYNACVYKYTL